MASLMMPGTTRFSTADHIDDDFLCRYTDPSRFEGLTCFGAIPFRVETMEEAEFARRIARVNNAIREVSSQNAFASTI
jgi:hypothetical protein